MKTMGRFAIAAATLLLCTTLLIVATPKRTEGTVAAAVQVMNTVDAPVPVAVQTNGGVPVDLEYFGVRTPFQINVGPNGPAQFTVPNEQRLVIEYLSASCHGTDVEQVEMQTTLSDGTSAVHYFAPVSTGGQSFIVSQSTHIYAHAGTTVVFSSASAAGATCTYAVAGYLVLH